MITIVFETHATTTDNEAGLAAGYYDVALSSIGEQQAKGLGKRYAGQHFDAIFCSDLQRSYRTAELAFGSAFPVIKDARLRECDYGDLTQKSKELIEQEKPSRLTTPFPNGESYADTSARMKNFLDGLSQEYQDKKVMIIGHRATQYGLENT